MFNIGILDDDENYLELLLKMLDTKDCNPIELENTKDISQQVIKNDIDLVITDYWMEGLNGHKINKLLKINPKTKDLPVILLSGSINRKKGIDKGFNQYIHKPIDLESLWNIVKEHYDKNKDSHKLSLYEVDENYRAEIATNLVEDNYKVFGYSIFDTLIDEMKQGIIPELIILDLKNGIDHPEKMINRIKKIGKFPIIFLLKNKFDTSSLHFLKENSILLLSQFDGIESQISTFLTKYFNKEKVISKKEQLKLDYLKPQNKNFSKLKKIKKYIDNLELKLANQSIGGIIDETDKLIKISDADIFTDIKRVADSIHGLAELDNKISGSLYKLYLELKGEYITVLKEFESDSA